jgi:hypothetical protein
MPPALDEAKVRRLGKLAARLDGAYYGGANPAVWEDDLAEFNRMAGTALPIQEFQGIYGAEEHEEWVRRLLYTQSLVPADVSREEMVEIVKRALPENDSPDCDFYLELFLVNCKHPAGSDLIFWPNLVPELPLDREPTAEEIAELAIGGRAKPGAVPDCGPR